MHDPATEVLKFLDLESVKAVLDFLQKAVAAGVGAWAAFRFQEYRETRKERGDRIHALREALFLLSSQRGFLLILDQDQLAPMRDDPSRHLLLRPPLFGRAPLPLDLTKLVFLIKLHKSGSLISQLDLAEARFSFVERLLEERRNLHYRVQDRLAATGEAWGDGATLEEAVTAVVGRPSVLQLKQMTDALYESVAPALATNRECVTAIQEFIKEQFPA